MWLREQESNAPQHIYYVHLSHQDANRILFLFSSVRSFPLHLLSAGTMEI